MHKRSIGLQSYFLLDINAVVRYLIMSDVLLVGASSMLAPIFALFIIRDIQGGNEIVAGIAAAIYLITKSLFQIPVATIIDRIRGEKDDFGILVCFSVIMALVPLLYLFISQPWQLYVVQFILGLFTAMTFPSFMAIFTRHIDRKKEATEWGVYFTLTDFASAGLAGIGGVIAGTAGFPALIIAVVVLSVIGGLLLIPIKPYLRLR
ncbi:MAG: MFS transporter [Candidatus Uhrbacteria bacterium]|nr:MFS transporter [Candidatus Uhrbacteria bacterium]